MSYSSKQIDFIRSFSCEHIFRNCCVDFGLDIYNLFASTLLKIKLNSFYMNFSDSVVRKTVTFKKGINKFIFLNDSGSTSFRMKDLED